MAKRISDKLWQRYRDIVTSFIDEDAGKQTIIWKKASSLPSSFGEDKGRSFLPDIHLDVLIAYNFFRTWPINKTTVSGELDSQNCTIWISAKKLSELGHLNSQGYWDMNNVEDRFIIKGIVYKPSGDTEVAQAKDDNVLFLVILKREEREELNK